MGKASTYQRRARDYAQKADWDAALAELRQAASADPANPMLQNQMGDLFLRKEEVGQACQHFEKAIELYAGLGLHNNAVALCRKVIRLCPSRLEVRYQLACLRHEQGLRSEASAFFTDYFDHLPVDGDASIRTLEERSTEVVESYADSAPVGRILEKLEDARAFARAFALVQGLAQRATDAGDDEAARRYTTKMRSLRVLVESHGGDLPQTADVVPREEEKPSHGSSNASPPQETGESEAPPQTAAPSAEASSWLEPSNVFEPPNLEVPEPLDLDTAKPGARAGGASDHGQSVPEIVPEEAAETPSARDTTPPVTELPEDGVKGADAGAILESTHDDDPSGLEYEIPETSLEDVAALWSDEGASAVDGVRGASGGPETPEAFPELVLEPEEAPALGTPLESKAETPRRARQSAPARPPQEARGDLPSAVESMQEIVPPHTTPRWEMPPPSAPAPRDTPLHDPVWVPEGEWGESNREPWPEAGSIHELSEVIETFRTQMAHALGDDAAARYDLGVAYYEMGLYNEALAEFEAAQPNAALRERSLEMMAACMAMQGRHAEILDLLAPALESPTAPERVLGLRYSMGVACEALGRRDEARQHFEVVARIDSGYRDVRTRLQMR